MSYLEFHKKWIDLGYFTIRQVYAWKPDFNRFNLKNWERKGYIARLKKGFYAFTECKSRPEFIRYLAGQIYMPSYISLHSALDFYGMIPEAVVQITSVSPLKTNQFNNYFGHYSYHSIKPTLMFGYVPKMTPERRAIMFATPEKALLDLLYLYPFYKTEQDMIDLRLDEDFMSEDFDLSKFMEYITKVNSPALTRRAKTLITAYNL